jgi:hypothetical protein
VRKVRPESNGWRNTKISFDSLNQHFTLGDTNKVLPHALFGDKTKIVLSSYLGIGRTKRFCLEQRLMRHMAFNDIALDITLNNMRNHSGWQHGLSRESILQWRTSHLPVQNHPIHLILPLPITLIPPQKFPSTILVRKIPPCQLASTVLLR